MTKWVIVNNTEKTTVYGRIDEDGLMRITAIQGYSELDEWLAEGNTPEVTDETS
jgi:hypothetical protein